MQEIQNQIQELITLREERKRIYIKPISKEITKLKKLLFIRKLRSNK